MVGSFGARLQPTTSRWSAGKLPRRNRPRGPSRPTQEDRWRPPDHAGEQAQPRLDLVAGADRCIGNIAHISAVGEMAPAPAWPDRGPAARGRTGRRARPGRMPVPIPRAPGDPRAAVRRRYRHDSRHATIRIQMAGEIARVQAAHAVAEQGEARGWMALANGGQRLRSLRDRAGERHARGQHLHPFAAQCRGDVAEVDAGPMRTKPRKPCSSTRKPCSSTAAEGPASLTSCTRPCGRGIGGGVHWGRRAVTAAVTPRKAPDRGRGSGRRRFRGRSTGGRRRARRRRRSAAPRRAGGGWSRPGAGSACGCRRYWRGGRTAARFRPA